jgi:lipase chaperone LimK
MNRRRTATALVAFALLAVAPAAAQARPLPAPPSRHHTNATRDALLTYFVEAYRAAPLTDKRRLHNEITLILSDAQFTP